MRINPSLLQDVELELPLKTNRAIFTTHHVSVVQEIGNYFGANLDDRRVHWHQGIAPTVRIGRDGWSEDKKSYEGLLTKPSEFSSTCTAEDKFIFRLICMHLNEIGLQSWMDYDTNLEEWITSQLQRLEEITSQLQRLEKDSQNSKDEYFIELNKDKVIEEIRNVQDGCVALFIDIDGYF